MELGYLFAHASSRWSPWSPGSTACSGAWAASSIWQKASTVVLAFGVIQAASLLKFGDFAVFSAFDQGLLFQAVTMTMVALGLNLIYGFNGQFSLAQWGFYGIGAYCAADITYRWTNGDASGLIVVGLGVILGALALVGVGASCK